MSDELPIGPSVLAPGARPGRGDWIARAIIYPLLAFLALLLLFFYIRYTPTRVDGESMEPTLSHGDRLLLSKSYRTPRRGDIVSFITPGGNGSDDRMLKRVIALPGDVIDIEAGRATVNGIPESGRPLIPDPADPVVIQSAPVPEGTVIVLGDNRAVSLDSRRIGAIPLSSVKGRVVFRWAPIHRIGVP